MNYLQISWSTSKGRDTYGYNICRLMDQNAQKRYRCMGGGYDMLGTVVGDWLQANFQSRLQFLAKSDNRTLVDCGYSVPGWTKCPDLYGLTFNPKGEARIDGACGIESVLRIAEAIGLTLTRNQDRRGTRGFFVSGD